MRVSAELNLCWGFPGSVTNGSFRSLPLPVTLLRRCVYDHVADTLCYWRWPILFSGVRTDAQPEVTVLLAVK